MNVVGHDDVAAEGVALAIEMFEATLHLVGDHRVVQEASAVTAIQFVLEACAEEGEGFFAQFVRDLIGQLSKCGFSFAPSP